MQFSNLLGWIDKDMLKCIWSLRAGAIAYSKLAVAIYFSKLAKTKRLFRGNSCLSEALNHFFTLKNYSHPNGNQS